MDLQGRGRVREGAVMHVHVEAKVLQEIGTQDRLLDVCNNKNPSKGSAQSEVEGKGANPKRCNLGTIDCLQIEGVLSMRTFSA